ncbi:MAG: Phage shock protein A [Candidatus Moanabacter tarae]|uniref:Phage shock protein A n=1 Tax=Candidatus Moanibacter tarae TaxID=2200854 RepID=A0A2Z4AGH9_9BACT|nr:MAG: Phage shock protein A [Candidatus Moanabacter tarae]|tara:strand:- start:14079 stop:14777 length:699 start_codon:yes stop_codon:yes gene_type:complete
MSIFSRIFKIGQASVHKVVEELEKPELMLEQAIRDKADQIRDAKKAIQECIATERKTKALLEKDKTARFSWEQKAEAALKAGKEELAVKALQRATEHDQKAKTLDENWKSQRDSVDSLKTDISKMEDELAEFKRNKDFILAQSKAAAVKKNIYEAKAKISKKDDADDLMARLQAKAERHTYEAEAAKEMSDSFSEADSLEKEFQDLGTTSGGSDVQEKLAAMKAKLGGGASA